MRLAVRIIGGAVVLCCSFSLPYGSLSLTAPPQRLEDQRISYYSDLPTASQNAGLRYSEQMKGGVDGFSRINEREVKVGGWVADPLGDSTPSLPTAKSSDASGAADRSEYRQAAGVGAEEFC